MRLEFDYTFADYQEAARYRSPAVPGRTVNWLMVGCAAIVVVATTVNLMMSDKGAAGTGSTADAGLAQWLPWVVVFAVIWLVSFLLLRRAGNSEWASTAGVARRQVVDIWPDRLVMWDAAHRAEYLWPYFIAFRETKNLLLLYPYDASTRIIPKRALPDPAQLDWLRGMLRQTIGREL